MTTRTIKRTSVGDRQFDVLCSLADHDTRNLDQLAEHMKHTIRRGHLRLHSQLRDDARQAVKAMVVRGFAVKLDVELYAITDAGKGWLEGTEQ